MKRPLVCLTVSFCLGIAFAHFIRIPFLLIYTLAVISSILTFLSLKKKLRFDIFLLTFIFFLGVAALRNSQALPPCHISRYISYANDNIYLVRGFVISEPSLKINRFSFIFETKEIRFNNSRRNCCGNILVYTRGRKDLHYAQELVLQGNLYRPFAFNRAKRKNYRDYLYNQGIYSVMNARIIQTAGLKRSRGIAIERLAFGLKQAMEDIIFKYTPPITASIFNAMILGDKRNIPPHVYNSMIKSGTVHILVVSGFNVGIVAFMVILFLKFIRIPKRARFFFAVPLLLLYCLMTGASTPVVRSTIMAIVFMFAYLVKREPDIYNSCALAALFILMFNPRQLFDVGFQLSFMSVISIVYLYPKIRMFLRLDSCSGRKKRLVPFGMFLVDSGLVSFSAWLGTAGLVAYYFRLFSPVTVLANIVIVPLATLITLCGFSLVIIELILPSLSPFFASSSQLIASLLLKVNAFLIKLPAAYFYLP